MRPEARQGARRFAVTPLGIAGAIGGTLLFAWYLRAVGLAEVVEGVRRIGAGFLFVAVLSGLRFVLRAAAWVQCVEEGRLRLRHALVAFLAGDAIGNLTPLGLVASESVKAVFARRHLRAVIALSSLALENLFYSLSVAAMVSLGTLAFLIAFPLTPSVRTASFIVAGCALLSAAALCWLLYGQPRLLSKTARWITSRRPLAGLRAQLDGIGRLEGHIHGFSARYPRRVALVLLLELLFHVSSIAEIYVLLILLVGPSPHTVLQAVVLETVNRVVMVAFKFVPLRVGVDEAGSGLVAAALGLGSVTGVALALTRKARSILWLGVGLGVLVQAGFSMGRIVKQAEAVLEREQE